MCGFARRTQQDDTIARDRAESIARQERSEGDLNITGITDGEFALLIIEDGSAEPYGAVADRDGIIGLVPPLLLEAFGLTGLAHAELPNEARLDRASAEEVFAHTLSV